MEPFEPVGLTPLNYDSVTLFYLTIVIVYFSFLHCMLKRREKRINDDDQVEKIDDISA